MRRSDDMSTDDMEKLLSNIRNRYIAMYGEIDKDLEIVHNFFDSILRHVAKGCDILQLIHLINVTLRNHVKNNFPNTVEEFDKAFQDLE